MVEGLDDGRDWGLGGDLRLGLEVEMGVWTWRKGLDLSWTQVWIAVGVMVGVKVWIKIRLGWGFGVVLWIRVGMVFGVWIEVVSVVRVWVWIPIFWFEPCNRLALVSGASRIFGVQHFFLGFENPTQVLDQWQSNPCRNPNKPMGWVWGLACGLYWVGLGRVGWFGEGWVGDGFGDWVLRAVFDSKKFESPNRFLFASGTRWFFDL